MAKPKKTPKEKFEAEYSDFVSEVLGLTADQLNARLATLAKGFDESETHRENNEDLAKAKEEVAGLSETYNIVKKETRAKSRYIIGILKDRGTP